MIVFNGPLNISFPHPNYVKYIKDENHALGARSGQFFAIVYLISPITHLKVRLIVALRRNFSSTNFHIRHSNRKL